MAQSEEVTTKNADIKIEGYGPDRCPHCEVYVGHSYWTHQALNHFELNPKQPIAEGKPKKKKNR